MKQSKHNTVALVFQGVALSLLVVLVIFVVDNYEKLRPSRIEYTIRSFFEVEKTEAEQYEYSPDSSNTFEIYLDGLSVLSSTELTLYDASGVVMMEKPLHFTKPVIKTAGDYLMAYDVGGTGLIALQKGHELNAPVVAGTIFTAAISKSGIYATVNEETGSKSTVTVYNDQASMLYRWISSELYITSCALSGDGQTMVLAGSNQAEARIQSRILLLSLSRPEPLATYDLEDVLVLGLNIAPDGTIAVLTEDTVLFFDPAGQKISEYLFERKILRSGSLRGEGFVVLRMSGVGDNSNLIAVHPDGTLQEKSIVNLLAVDVKGNRIGVLTTDKGIVYNEHLEEQFQFSVSPGSKAIRILEEGDCMTLSSTRAVLHR